MSHVTTAQVEIKDLDAVRAACTELGVEFRMGQRSYKWWGHHVGDYPLPPDIPKDTLGQCDHAIRVPGVDYEIGVVRKANGAYTLAYDFYGPGQGLLRKFGPDCRLLVQSCAKNQAVRAFQRKGYRVRSTESRDGRVQLKVTKGW